MIGHDDAIEESLGRTTAVELITARQDNSERKLRLP